MINNTITARTLIRRAALALSIPATLAGLAVGTAGVASAATPFGTPGEIVDQASDGRVDWTVPAGVSSVHLHLVGGSGHDGGSGAGAAGGKGGRGGTVDETVSVKPGQIVSLLPGTSARAGGNAYGDSSGGNGGVGDVNGGGGNGGAASWVTVDGQVIGLAGGGGGGGGGGAVYSYKGGDGGDAQSRGYAGTGAGAGSGGNGNIAGDAYTHHGETAGNAPFSSYAGAAGGGGAGWNGAGLGGGRAGVSGSYGGGGGGGAAGGASWGVDPNTSYGTRSVQGDGVIVLDWTVASTTTSMLTAPSSTPQGRPVTLTDTITPSLTGGPGASGTVTFEMANTLDSSRSVIGTAKVVAGVASLTTTALPGGQYNGIHAIYSGDSNYQGSTSDWVYPKITAPIKTISLSPSVLAFGNRPLNSLKTMTVQLTNTGSTDWAWTSAATDNGDVNMPNTTCSSLKPGASCTVTVSFQPSTLGAVSAHITMASNFGTITIPVTGTGVTPAPTVTKVSPTSGSHLGGTRITVTGTNFVNVSSITVGGTQTTAVSCSSATTCTATTPAGTVGTKDVRVVSATGTSAVTTVDQFSYL